MLLLLCIFVMEAKNTAAIGQNVLIYVDSCSVQLNTW